MITIININIVLISTVEEADRSGEWVDLTVSPNLIWKRQHVVTLEEVIIIGEDHALSRLLHLRPLKWLICHLSLDPNIYRRPPHP
ncbi:unnamed protein product [Arctia plantaginis]|uniref:Uncharacterized protein n=1 Tax=Arctia plantaginis TaxID=874455 RepID=A0A8S0Z837_ARCPL|nr:unnamed protein product [Arctia plantaginis]